MTRTLTVLITALVAWTAGLAGTSRPVTFDEAIAVWVEAGAVRIGGTPDDPVFIDCFDAVSSRVNPRFVKLAQQLERISGYLSAELGDEQAQAMYVADMFGMAQAQEHYLYLILHKNDWSAGAVKLIREAVTSAGMTPAATFPDSALDVHAPPVTMGCTSGRCDCVDCPSNKTCDCKTPTYGSGGFPVDCAGPRTTCSTSKPKRLDMLW